MPNTYQFNSANTQIASESPVNIPGPKSNFVDRITSWANLDFTSSPDFFTITKEEGGAIQNSTPTGDIFLRCVLLSQ